MTYRICCACGRPGHLSHACPAGEAIRQQHRNPPPPPQPVKEPEPDFDWLKGWNGY